VNRVASRCLLDLRQKELLVLYEQASKCRKLIRSDANAVR
jgi:hypothetical protein